MSLTVYESLLAEADQEGIITKEKNLQASDGLIVGNRIAIRDGMTGVKKSCVLAEELGHYYTSSGNILDQDDVRNRQQELRARAWAYDKRIGLIGLIRAFEYGCRNRYEMAEFLEVTEAFLDDALNYYKNQYGMYKRVDNYVIYFEPRLWIADMNLGI